MEIPHLTPLERDLLTQLITLFSDIFALDGSELGTTTLVRHVIDTGDQTPIWQAVRRMPFALRQDVDRMVGEMLAQEVIRPSCSPCVSPIVLVKRKIGIAVLC